MNMKELAAALTARAVDARLAQDKASMGGHREVAAKYAGEVTAYVEAAALTGETTRQEASNAAENALFA